MTKKTVTMLEDAQRMITGRMFDGPLECSTERVGGEPKPGGKFETRCRVPGLQGMCALVSREWQKEFREWRDKEIDKRFRRMCHGVLYRAMDMCNRGKYSKRASVPNLTTFEDAFFFHGVKVVTLGFQRTGMKDEHVLSTHVSIGLKTHVRTVETPRSGWKWIRSMLDEDFDEWNAWADAEWEAQHAWIWSCL